MFVVSQVRDEGRLDDEEVELVSDVVEDVVLELVREEDDEEELWVADDATDELIACELLELVLVVDVVELLLRAKYPAARMMTIMTTTIPTVAALVSAFLI